MSESIKVSCPHCGAKMKLASARSLGKRAKCPKCSKAFVTELPPEDNDFPAADEFDDFDEFAVAKGPVRPAPSRVLMKEDSSAQRPVFEFEDTKPKKASASIRSLVWTATGLAGAVLGLLIWITVARLSHHEWGFLAIFMGVLIGIGVRLGGRNDYGSALGLTAVSIALTAFFIGKIAVLVVLIRAAQSEQMTVWNPKKEEACIAWIAEKIKEEQEKTGFVSEWTMPPTLAPKLEFQYHPGIWGAASEGWQAMEEPEREKIREEIKEHARKTVEMPYGLPYDILETTDRKQLLGSLYQMDMLDLLWIPAMLAAAFFIGSKPPG